jgi:hypothetical protein
MPNRPNEPSLFTTIFMAMGTLLLAVAVWIGSSVAHIPTIEQKLQDFMEAANKTLGDHEARIRTLEVKEKGSD